MIVLVTAFVKFFKGWVLSQEINVDLSGHLVEQCPASVSCSESAAAWKINKAGLHQIKFGPMGTVMEDPLLSAWKQLVSFFGRKSKLVSQFLLSFQYAHFT